MLETTTADKPSRLKGKRRGPSRLRDGVVKRGSTWSYVIRVKDPEKGTSRPRWVGGFATEEAAKAARDEARVKARQGEYVDRNSITVTAYLGGWIESHAMEIKPRTLHDYRACIRLYVTPRIGRMPIQAVRPATITKLYRDLLTGGGRGRQAARSRDRDPPACGASHGVP
jgi:integrase